MFEQDYRHEMDRVAMEPAFSARLVDAMAAEQLQVRRPRISRRVGIAAACLVLALCLTAMAVVPLARYLSGVGAVARGVEVLVLEEPVEWTEGDWTYRLSVEQVGEVIHVDLDQRSSKAIPGRDDGEGDYAYRMKMFAGEEPLEAGVYLLLQGGWHSSPEIWSEGQYTSLEGSTDGTPAVQLDEGFVTRGSVSADFLAEEQPPEGYTLQICTLDDQVLWEKEIRLAAAQELEMHQETRSFPGGTVTALVSRDGRTLSFYPDQTVEENGSCLYHVAASDVEFISDSGTRYPAHLAADGSGSLVCRAPEGVSIAAVEIPTLLLSRMAVSNGVQRDQWPVTYEDVDWIIRLP